jgi:hypothetical protein
MGWGCVRLVAAVVLLGLVTHGVATTPATAKGADPCPEPNDAFQQACLLEAGKEVAGFIFHGNDMDAYRIVALDFRVGLQLELTEAPFPYRLEVADWNGKVIASSLDRLLDVTLVQPGAYYAFVWSPGGQASDDQPYRLAARLTYPNGAPPEVVVSHDFGGIADRQAESDEGTFIWAGGRLSVSAKKPRTANSA